jgi:tetratricopeptide (TPR) repeat protein
LERKVRFYQRLLVAELTANPRNASAWCSLGMQFTNDGHDEKAIECFRRAIASDPSGFLPYRELGLAKLREGRTLFEMVARCLPASHDYHRVAQAGADWLGRFAPDQPLVGLAARGPEHVPPEADVALPEFPPIEDADNPFAGLVGGETPAKSEPG